MTRSAEINTRQNEERMLRIQFAARKYYSSAEVLNFLVWLCFIIAWLTTFLLDTDKCSTLSMIFSGIAEVTSFVLWGILTKCISRAASLRSFFDAYIFDIPSWQPSRTEIASFDEWAFDIVEKNNDTYAVQCNNTGRDIPPGVRNWYEFPKEYNGLSAIYECQRQNKWWTQKVSHFKFLIDILMVMLFLMLVIHVICLFAPEKGWLTVVLSSIGLIIKCIEQFAARIKGYLLTVKMSGQIEVIDMLDNCLNEEVLQCLQKSINERRAMPILESNFIHSNNAKRLSEKYSKLFR